MTTIKTCWYSQTQFGGRFCCFMTSYIFKFCCSWKETIKTPPQRASLHNSKNRFFRWILHILNVKLSFWICFQVLSKGFFFQKYVQVLSNGFLLTKKWTKYSGWGGGKEKTQQSRQARPRPGEKETLNVEVKRTE